MAMTLVDHLEELRRRLFFCVGAVVLGAFVAFVFHAPILEFLLSPLPVKPTPSSATAARSRSP